MPAKANAVWQGDLKGGSGKFAAGGGGVEGAYSFTSRFEDGGGPGATPEELLGAAHASCFSMALSNMLALAGSTPESVRTDAVVTMGRTDDGPTITKVTLTTVGRVPGNDQAAFAEAAEQTRATCTVSRALAAIPEVTIEATLEG